MSASSSILQTIIITFHEEPSEPNTPVCANHLPKG